MRADEFQLLIARDKDIYNHSGEDYAKALQKFLQSEFDQLGLPYVAQIYHKRTVHKTKSGKVFVRGRNANN